MLIHALAITVIIQITNLAGVPAPVVRDAQASASAILADIDVAVEWVDASASVPAESSVIRLTLLKEETGALRSHDGVVLGAAVRTPMGSNVAWVYYARVVEEADRHAVPPARLLACAMAHEIGHLVRSPAHEPDGLMRAVWTAADFRRASAGRLRFAGKAP